MRSTRDGDEHAKHGLLYGRSTPVGEMGLEGRPSIMAAGAEERIAAAKLVVVGTVSSVARTAQRTRRPVTRHDPVWMKALIEVDAVEKGSLPGKTIEVVFPASTDVRWYRAPKFSEGQQGIWTLHRTRVQMLNAETYTSLHPRDFHPKDQLSYIRRLIAAGKGR